MVDTIKIVRGNVELDVPADQKDRYLTLGYSVVDNKGKIVEEAPLKDIGALQTKVALLEDENKKLKAEITKLKAPTKKTTKSE